MVDLSILLITCKAAGKSHQVVSATYWNYPVNSKCNSHRKNKMHKSYINYNRAIKSETNVQRIKQQLDTETES